MKESKKDVSIEQEGKKIWPTESNLVELNKTSFITLDKKGTNPLQRR